MKISTRKPRISQDASLQAVYFEYTDPSARSVAIAGTFNDWRPQVTPMVNMGAGRWRKVLMVVPGTYEYTFVVDGRPLEQSVNHATDCETTAPNAFRKLSGRQDVAVLGQQPQ